MHYIFFLTKCHILFAQPSVNWVAEEIVDLHCAKVDKIYNANNTQWSLFYFNSDIIFDENSLRVCDHIFLILNNFNEKSIEFLSNEKHVTHIKDNIREFWRPIVLNYLTYYLKIMKFFLISIIKVCYIGKVVFYIFDELYLKNSNLTRIDYLKLISKRIFVDLFLRITQIVKPLNFYFGNKQQTNFLFLSHSYE